MKILILIKRWKGGVGRYVSEVQEELKKRGHEVIVVSREDDMKIFSLKGSIFKIRSYIKACMKMEDSKFDIIYTLDWGMAFPLLYPYCIFKKEHFCCFQGNDPNTFGRVLQFIVGNKMKDKLIVVGTTIYDNFKDANLIYSGVNTKEFKPLKKKRTHLGWIDKGTEVLNEEDVKKICKRLKIPLLIARDIPHEKMNDFYNQCKIFISLPPESAGFNLCWVEAMASGVPIVIGNDEGIGSQLPINKVRNDAEFHAGSIDYTNQLYREDVIKIVKSPIIQGDYDKLIKENFIWSDHVEKLIGVWKGK
jgi:glycosyltransferase involved in cell wall biosynthesis